MSSMKELKRIVLLALLVIVIGIGASLTLKVAIGVGAWDALTQSISFLTTIKVGTVGMMLNISCIVGQLFLLRKKFQLKHLLQLPITILIGFVINFIYYDVLGSVNLDQYVIKLIIFIGALTILAFALAIVMLLDIVTFPLEGFCMAIAKKMNWKFAVVRQSADIISFLLAVGLTFGLSLPLSLREGTVIAMLSFAPLMGYFMKKLQPLLRKWDLLHEEAESIPVNQDSAKAI